MDFTLIDKKQNCPFEVKICDANPAKKHFHKELELLFVLCGSIIFEINDKKYTLNEHDILLVNSYENHTLVQFEENTRILFIKINTVHFQFLFPSASAKPFLWEETFNNPRNPLYQKIVSEFRTIVIQATNQNTDYLAQCYKSILEILILFQSCCKKKESLTSSLSKNIQKMSELTEYLELHYDEDIDLSIVANQLDLSVSYASKIFKEFTGHKFIEYLNQLRVQKSLISLCSSNDYILDIAMSVGFNNIKSYNRAFQQAFQMTPAEYRKKNKVLPVPANDQKEAKDSSSADLMPNLLQFIYNQKSSEKDASKPQPGITLDLNLTHPVFHKQKTSWKQILSLGHASILLQQKIQQDILQAVSDIGFTEVRITGVLSDIMQIYQEDENGNPYYFWRLIDDALDFLYRNRLKPYICLGYMPNKLAAHQSISPYQWGANISKPKSMTIWQSYLRAFLIHCISRYSYEEVTTWKFEFWNTYDFFWQDDFLEYLDLYKCTYQTFREVLPKGLFSSPCFIGTSTETFIRHVISFCKEEKIHYDFYPLHLYMTADPQNKPPGQSENQPEDIGILKRNSYYDNFINNSLETFSEIIQACHAKAPIIISEWNLSPYYHDYIRDTSFMAAYIAKTLNTLPDTVESISFWALTDSLGEYPPYQSMFMGELGLKTFNGIPKPSYLAFDLINQMSSNLIKKGNGYRITQTTESTQILLYNYIFFRDDFLYGSSYKLSYHDRYQIFEHQSDLTFQLHLQLIPGTYRLEFHQLDRNHGSIYDSWINMGAPDYSDPVIEHYLSQKACADVRITTVQVDKHLLLSEAIPEHGLLLLKLIRVS